MSLCRETHYFKNSALQIQKSMVLYDCGQKRLTKLHTKILSNDVKTAGQSGFTTARRKAGQAGPRFSMDNGQHGLRYAKLLYGYYLYLYTLPIIYGGIRSSEKISRHLLRKRQAVSGIHTVGRPVFLPESEISGGRGKMEAPENEKKTLQEKESMVISFQVRYN